MKHLKHFESITEKEPQLYDYVVCNDKFFTDKEILNFIANNVGQIVKLNYPDAIDKIKNTTYEIRYKNVPQKHKDAFDFNVEDHNTGDVLEHRNEIIFFSPHKKEAKQFLLNSKFNL